MGGVLRNNDCVFTNDGADGFQLIYGVIKEHKTQSLRWTGWPLSSLT